MPDPEILEIHPPGPISHRPVYGLDEHRRAFMNLLRHGLSTNTSDLCTFLFFGWAGTSKTQFAANVISTLHEEGTSLQYIVVPCTHLVARCDVNRAWEELQRIDNLVRQNPGTLVVFDEVDAVAGIRLRGSNLNVLTDVVHGLLSVSYERTAFCGVTNEPSLIDDPVSSRLDNAVLYFPPPTPETIVAMLADAGIERTQAPRVAAILSNSADSAGAFYSGRALRQACLKIVGLMKDKAFKDRTSDDIAEDISMYAHLTPKGALRKFESEHKQLIARSKTLVSRWQRPA